MTGVKIRPLAPDDFPNWLPLWDGNNQGQRDETVTSETWSRLMDSGSPVYGLGALKKDKMVGLVHYILHPTTGAIEPVCYMQDVYVDPSHRKKGIARALVLEVARTGKKEKWARMQWVAQSNNAGAQKLYETLGVKLDFTFHVLPTTPLSS